MKPRPRLAASLLLPGLLLASSCSDDDAGGTTSSSGSYERSTDRDRGEDDGGEPAPAGERQPIDPATVGSIHGVVSFDGDPPERRPLALGSTAGCKEHATPPLKETLIVSPAGGIQYTYVYVKKGLAAWEMPGPPSKPAMMDQSGCVYRPHVLALQTGQKLHIRNSDQATHNVNLNARRNGQTGNYNQGQGQDDIELLFERREHSIPFQCDAHPWMKAVVHVQDHPFFAVTAADGTFTISGLPAGRYTIETIHEKLGKARTEVVVAAGETAEARLIYAE